MLAFDLPSHQVLSWLPVALIALYVVEILSRTFFGPLRRVPGPWATLLSSLPLRYQAIKARKVFWVHELHQKYGPVVRISPSEIDVADIEAFSEIHKIGSPFLKSPWYVMFRGAVNCFTCSDPKIHGRKRKTLARPFSKTSLRGNWEAVVVNLAKQTVAKMKEEATQGTTDLLKWWTFFATDVTGEVAFGEAFGLVESGQKPKYILDLESVNRARALRAEVAPLYNVLKTCTFGYFDPLGQADRNIERMSFDIMRNARLRQLPKANIISGVLNESDPEDRFSEREALLEAIMLVVAGSGTTAITLTYLCWAVMFNPAYQKRLEEELASVGQDFGDAQLEALPFLNAVVQETLRLYGAAPGGLPRTSPKGGCRLAGFYIPEGLTINTQAFSLHRDPLTYNDPLEFRPERYLDGKMDGKAVFAPFGSGSRTCLGIHLAYMELRLAAATFFRECAGVKLADVTTPESMEIVQYFLIAPKAQRCLVALR
ncbi:cytochrome P450 monooxygenase [Dactylonectria estremocensis]|uniref:Cytochrome P450 monooxygenase n=1 Tax=Dactylonectria estremocensis TaxID=1079267 RepID=A0A9P9J2X8_9HYPO|nr:cytochrome P450 monooxygenase [Dactylonectria estremocensis]